MGRRSSEDFSLRVCGNNRRRDKCGRRYRTRARRRRRTRRRKTSEMPSHQTQSTPRFANSTALSRQVSANRIPPDQRMQKRVMLIPLFRIGHMSLVTCWDVPPHILRTRLCHRALGSAHDWTRQPDRDCLDVERQERQRCANLQKRNAFQTLQGSHKGHYVRLLLLGQLPIEHEVEIFYRVFQRE